MDSKKDKDGCLVGLIQLGVPLAGFVLIFLAQRFAAHVGSAAFAVVATSAAALLSAGLAVLVGGKAGPRGRIAAVILGFLALIVCFGAVYQIQYARDPTAFVFSAEVNGRRGLETFRDSYAALREQNEKLLLLALLEGHPSAGVEAIKTGRTVKVDSRRSVRYRIVSNPAGPSATFFSMEEEGREVELGSNNLIDPVLPLVGGLSKGKDVDTFLVQLRALLSYYEAERAVTQERLERGLSQSAPWDFLDFVYFSAITMATVGYGDIVPSSRTARMLVLGQAILGVSYMGFALAFLWPVRPTQNAERQHAADGAPRCC